jgi:N-acetylneuraminic acid mutarotase
VGQDGAIYLFGGSDGSGATAINTAVKFDPVGQTWLSISSMHERRYDPGYATDDLGRIYAIGGQNEVDLHTVERYDPARDVWEYVANLPDNYGSTNAAFTLDGDIWVVGGWYMWGFTANTRIYDPDSNTWSEGPAMYEALGGATAAVGFSGTAYVFGGQRSGGGPGSDHVAELVPEPVTMLGVFAGCTGLGGYIRKRCLA